MGTMTSAAGAGLITDAVQLQNAMRDWAQARRTPFGTVVPKHALPVFSWGAAGVPNYGVQVQVVQYQVKPNWFALICGIVMQFSGNGSAPVPNDVSFTVDVDIKLGSAGGGGGFTEKDFNGVPFVLGSFTQVPWPCELKHHNGQIIRIKATPVQNMGVGQGNFFQAALIGWEWTEEGFE